MSITDCIEIALKHNLDIQIKRLNPELSLFTLEANYGAYDPSLYSDAKYSYSKQPASLDSNGRPIPQSELESDIFDSGFRGTLPWGMTYDLGISLTDQTTRHPAGSGPSILVTNSAFDLNTGTNISLVTTNSPQSAFFNETFKGNAGFMTLTQPLLKNFWIDNNRLQIILSKRDLKISELDLRFQIMTTINAVEQAYNTLIFDQEKIKVQQKALELAERQLAENKKRVEVGAMAPLDEKQAESQVASSRTDLLTALGAEESQQRVLKGLLSDDYAKWARISVRPTETLVALPEKFTLQESWRKGLSQRPDFLQQKIRLEQQGYKVRYQKNQMFPELDLVGTAGYDAGASTFGGYLDQFGGRDNPFYSVGGQLTVPLGNTSARNNYKIALTTKDQIALQLKQQEQNILIKIEDDIASINTKYQQVQSAREASIYAEAALDAEQKKLESGKSTSFIVLQLTSNLTSARSTYISALADYNNALAQLAFDEGDTLERRHVSLEYK